jgi:hypothetical protein
MTEAFFEDYTNAITSLIPLDIIDEARSIIAAYKPRGMVSGSEPLCMAGLKPNEHGDLNIPSIVYPGGKNARDIRIAELRTAYVDDQIALQQIDVYDDSTEYHVKLDQFKQALMSGNTCMEAELEAWFKKYYPDI